MNIYDEIKEKAQAMEPQLEAVRRDLHTYPETGWYEVRTSSIVAKRLDELGYQILIGPDVCLDESRMGLPSEEDLEKQYQRALAQGAVMPYAEKMRGGFTGVIGILDCGPGPVIAMRFDMDALGVFEEKSEAHRPTLEHFNSKNEGMMHACGHDGHTSIGLGVAEILMGMKDRLHGKIKLVFQPAEEGVRGAKSIADHGHMDDVDYILANHMADNYGTDYQIGCSMATTLATTKMDVFFTGKAAHAGMVPQAGHNAMLAACTAVLNIQAIPRNSDGDTRVNVGTLNCGSGRNVIPDRAKMEIEVRGATTEVNNYMVAYAERIVQAAAQMHECTAQIKLMGAAESLSSDPEMIERCVKVAGDKLHMKMMPPSPRAGASEDASYLLNRVRSHGGKAIYFNTLTPCGGEFHSKDFDIDEKVLPNAVALFCGMVVDLMGIEE